MSFGMKYPDDDQGHGLVRALSRISGVGSRNSAPSRDSMVDQARAAEKAAHNRRDEEDSINARVNVTRTAVRQADLEMWPLPGLAPMTRVRTSFGDVHAAALRKGDELLTRNGKFLPIVWLNRISLDEHILNLKPDSNPIVLAPGALGAGAPANEIMVSPRQIICADDVSGLSRPREASMLISRPGVRRLRETSLSYTMLHVGEPAEIYCEGLYLSFPLEA